VNGAIGKVGDLIGMAECKPTTASSVTGIGGRRGVAARECLRVGVAPERAGALAVVGFVVLGLAALLGGAILTESVFNIPGIGRLAFDSIQNSALPMIQGTVLLGAFFIIFANLVVDLLYAVVDPRVRVT